MLGQGANNVLNLLLLCGGGQDRGVAQHAVIQSVLGLFSLLPVAILDQSDPMCEIQVEIVQGTMLHTQGTEC